MYSGDEIDYYNLDILNEYDGNSVSAIGVEAADVSILGGAVRCLTNYIWGKPTKYICI